MDWKHLIGRRLLWAFLSGVTVNLVYFGLGFTQRLHGFSVKALGPTDDLVRRLDPHYVWPYRYLVVYAANVVLYTFWVFLALVALDLLRQFARKLVDRKGSA